MRSVRQLLIRQLAGCLLIGLSLLLPSARTIEVHEDVNEGPIGAHLRLNVSTSASSAPAPTTAAADERNVNDPPPPPALPGLGGNDNYNTTTTTTATFPSNHRQHSGPNVPAVALRPTTSSATPEAPTTSTTPPHASGPLPPVTRAPSGLSSFRAASSVAIVNDRAAQHQISGYRKRQLYASAVLQRNTSRFGEPTSSDGQFAKEFIPSPEVVPFFSEDNSMPMVGQVAAQGNFVPSGGGGAVDAPYPTGGLADGDSKWYAGFAHGYTTPGKFPQPRPTGGRDEPAGKWDHTLTTWQRHREHSAVQFPPDSGRSPAPAFPSPKGKWKWIPEDDEEAREEPARKPSATPFSSSGAGGVESPSAGSLEEQQQQQQQQEQQEQQEQQPYFGKYYLTHPSVKPHPYSFERTPGEAFPSPTTFSSDGGTVSSGNSSETSGDEPSSGGNGSTDGKLVGKEGAHFPSVSPWKKIIHVLSAAIPIGLLISALTPQVVYINPNATQPPIQLQTPTPISGAGPASGGIRQRSLGPETARMLLAARGLGTDPVALVKLFHKLAALERDVAQPSGEGFDGSNRLLDATGQPKLQGCDWRLLCQLARQGMLPEADALHRTLWKIASETPAEALGQLGLEEVFRIIRRGDCDRLQRTCDQDTRDGQ